MPAAVQTSLLAPRPSVDMKPIPVVKEARNVDARLLKKREADRKCQRKIRERAKARVASLEQVVEELKQKDTSGQVEALLKKLTEKNSEIETLNKKVKSIQAVLSDQASSDGNGSVNNADFNDYDSGFAAVQIPGIDMVSNVPIATETGTDEWATHQPPMADPSVDTEDFEVALSESNFDGTNSHIFEPTQNLVLSSPPDLVIKDGDPIVPASQKPCDCSQPSSAVGAPRNIWRFANEVLSSRFSWPDYVKNLDDLFIDDTPVRAVVEGWDAVERRGPVHPSWQLLKKIDQGIFWSCNPRERLAVLHVMHMLFNAHSRPEMLSDLPEFYQRRPSEDTVHSYAINFFTWPGMRERFVQQQHRYCTNDFWKILTGSLRVLWPYEFRDCYTRNIETGLYTISPLFSERLRDIKVWAIGPDLIQRWPEFNTDVPVFNSIPPTITNHFQRSRLLATNASFRNRSTKSERYSRDLEIATGKLASPVTTSPGLVAPKPAVNFNDLSSQALAWDSDFASHSYMVADSDYLGLQHLDSFSAPYT